MNFVRRDAMKISLVAQVALVLDEEPDLAFQHVIDLLRDMHVGLRVVARRPRGHHETALVAIGLPHDHRALSLVSPQYDFLHRNVFCFYAKGHKSPSFRQADEKDLPASFRSIVSLQRTRDWNNGLVEKWKDAFTPSNIRFRDLVRRLSWAEVEGSILCAPRI